MRILNFAKRNFKEIVRDPINMIFSIMLPLFLLFIFQQFRIPEEIYKIENFTPGIIIFSLSFITLSTAVLVSKDRSTSLLIRLSVSPMKPVEYIVGYIISILPIVFIQNILFFSLALLLGLEFSINIIFAMIVSLIISIMFVALGIFIGSITSGNSSSGVSSVVVQLVAFTSGMYFSADMVGKTFATICNLLPFKASLDIIKNILSASKTNMLNSIFTVSIYLIMSMALSIYVFKKNMIKDNK